MTGRKIVVLGGGFGGTAAARTARAALGFEHEVTLVDRNRRTYLCGSFPLLIVGEREAMKVSRSLGSMANRGVNYLQAEIEAIALESRTVATSEGALEYDYLVVAPGAVYDWDAVPGSAGAYSFYDLETARRLRRRLNSFRKGRILYFDILTHASAIEGPVKHQGGFEGCRRAFIRETGNGDQTFSLRSPCRWRSPGPRLANA